MKVLIGVDPHKKTSVAVAAVDQASGELVERAAFFPQDRTGLRRLERCWAKRFPERRSLGSGERRRPRSAPGGEVGGGW